MGHENMINNVEELQIEDLIEKVSDRREFVTVADIEKLEEMATLGGDTEAAKEGYQGGTEVGTVIALLEVQTVDGRGHLHHEHDD